MRVIVDSEVVNEKEVVVKMNSVLFTSITNVNNKLKLASELIDEAMEDLETAQLKSEEMYINM